MNNEDKQGIAVIIICGVLIIIGILLLINSFKVKTYEYALHGEIRESEECYQREDGICFCKEGNKYIQVDNYYEVKNEK